MAVLPGAVTRTQRVVPLRADGIGFKIQSTHLGIGNALADFVAAPFEQSTHLQSCLCHRASDVIEHRFKRAQWHACPVNADVAEQPVLDRIPLGAASQE